MKGPEDPQDKISLIWKFLKSLKRKLPQDPQDHPEERFLRGQFLKSLEMKDPQDPHNPKDHQDQ